MSADAAPSSWTVFTRLCWVFSGFLLLDVLFWSVVDFGTFVPPSAGAWLERADWAFVTALGPIAMTRIETLRSAGLVACLGIVLMAAAAIRWRHHAWLRALAFGGIVVWWILGLGIGGIRIT